MRPLIAVVGRRAVKSNVLRFSGSIAAEAVCDAVFRAGGEPVVVHGGDRAAITEIPARLARFDGVCLPGGGDLNPARYAQAADARSEAPDDLQDEFDLAVIRTVLGSAGLGRALPALAICRGIQVLNVACGGTLRQHVTGGVEHMNALHEVTIARGSPPPGSPREVNTPISRSDVLMSRLRRRDAQVREEPGCAELV